MLLHELKRKILLEINFRRKSGTTFLSYTFSLVKLCKLFDWDTIVEFGPGYSTQASLFFIDGGNRMDALRFAYKIMPESGIAFLHDAHREDYERGIRQFPHIFPRKALLHLEKSHLVYERIQKEINPDYSCNCRYCSSPERRSYFHQFVKLSPER